MCIRDSLSIDLQFIDTQATGIDSGRFQGAACCEITGEKEMLVLRESGGDPLGGPGFSLFGGFKPGLSAAAVACVAPDCDVPEIAGAGQQDQRRLKSQGADGFLPAAVIDLSLIHI